MRRLIGWIKGEFMPFFCVQHWANHLIFFNLRYCGVLKILFRYIYEKNVPDRISLNSKINKLSTSISFSFSSWLWLSFSFSLWWWKLGLNWHEDNSRQKRNNPDIKQSSQVSPILESGSFLSLPFCCVTWFATVIRYWWKISFTLWLYSFKASPNSSGRSSNITWKSKPGIVNILAIIHHLL